MTVVLLLASFPLILIGAVGFTNAVEWLGHRLNLGSGAVGALLAAVGTALPESTIPVIALLSGGGKEAEEIAFGSVIGAPMLLATLAMLLVAGAAFGFRERRGERGARVEPHIETTRRDLMLFGAAFSVALLLGLGVSGPLRVVGAVLLVVAYIVYAVRTARKGGETQDEEDLKRLYFDASPDDPPRGWQIGLQLLLSLAAIVAGAELFVHEVEAVAKSIGVETLILALVLAPLATEIPEKANSVIWMRQGKDDLALGNITGAMAFQATIPAAAVMLLTDWDLPTQALLAGVIALAGGLVAWWALGRRRFSGAPSFAWAALLVAFGVMLVVV